MHFLDGFHRGGSSGSSVTLSIAAVISCMQATLCLVREVWVSWANAGAVMQAAAPRPMKATVLFMVWKPFRCEKVLLSLSSVNRDGRHVM